MGKIISLSGPPASGKSRMARELMVRGYRPLLSVTTRPPRENGERKEVEYTHVSARKFREMASRNEFLWHIKHKGYRYGTERKVVEEALLGSAPHVAILLWEKAIELSDYLGSRGKGNDICLIFLIAPKGILWDRLRKRDGDTEKSRKNLLESEGWLQLAVSSGRPFQIVSTRGNPLETRDQIVRIAERS